MNDNLSLSLSLSERPRISQWYIAYQQTSYWSFIVHPT